MPKRLLTPLLAVLFSLTLFSCQQPLENEYLDYIGSWGSDRYSMEIWKNGRGVIEWGVRDAQECRVIIEDNQIKFRGEARRTFDIDEPPYITTEGYWVMILDGDVFYLH